MKCTFLFSFCLCIIHSLASITPVEDTTTIRDKLLSMLKSHDSAVELDSSITESAAKSIFNKYKSSQEANKNKNQNKNGIKIGKKMPFPSNDKNIHNRNLLLTSSGWEDSDKKHVLDLHNNYRSNVSSGVEPDDGTDGTYPSASNMNQLFWDDALALVAQTYSDNCVYGHNNNADSEFYSYTDYATFDYPTSGISLGENIAIYYTTSSNIYDYYLTNRVKAWWNESTLWHYQTIASATLNGAGHFTQMAWADTRYIGCGFSYCQDGSWNQYYLVCNYYPAGNYQTQYPYSSGSCSSGTCDGDRTVTCSDSLCAGCMDPDYTVSGSTSNSTDCCNGFVFVDGSSSGSDCDNGDVTPTSIGTSEFSIKSLFISLSIIALSLVAVVVVGI